MMNLWKGALAAAVLIGATASLPVQAHDTACGTDRTIDIAEMTWPSAAALAHIHATILEAGYGCNVEIVTGDTVPTSSSMLSRGTPAVAPELWTSAIEEPWAEGHRPTARSSSSPMPSPMARSKAGSSRAMCRKPTPN